MADISITASAVLPSTAGKVRKYTAGATIIAGKWVYLDPLTNTVKLADANAASPIYEVIGVAVNGASAGQPIRINREDPAHTLGGTIASGKVLILSDTPGGCALDVDGVTGWSKRVLGIGIAGNKIALSISDGGVI